MLTMLADAIADALLDESAISTAVGTRVYYKLAAESATLPYILLNEVGGGRTNDTPRDAFDMLWQVDVVAADGVTANTIAGDVQDVLKWPDGVTNLVLESPWKLADIQHEEPMYWIEQVERRQYHHAVDTFRIRGAV